MKTIKQLNLLFLALILGITSCIDEHSVEGNGIPATEGRIVSSFEKVKSSGAFEVHITSGNEYDVVVSADENLLQYIETYVSGKTLHLNVKGLRSLDNKLPMEIFITSPVLEGVKLSGSGSITTDYYVSDDVDITLSGSGSITTAFNADEVDVLLSGSGRIKLSGNTNRAEFTISGSGNIQASDLEISDCRTVTSGSGDMWVSVDQYLHSRISGSGSVFFYGNPTIEKHISGSGNVISYN